MTIAGEMLNDGFLIYAASIVTWDHSNGEFIDEQERQRILAQIQTSLTAQGSRVELG